ncbi:MAG: aminotransferase class I/II-fold pyridoxal phosphate-dependent enzyme [Bacteroidota bacterium]
MKSISLKAGELSRPPFEPVVQGAIHALQAGKTHYSPVEGIWDLRLAIADLYRAHQADIGPENVLITPGVRQAIFNVLTNTVRPGDEVILPSPYYFSLPSLIEQAGGKVVILETKASDNFTISAKALERLITPDTRLFIFNNPCNPTGRVYSPAEIEALADVLQRHAHVHILSDEIYEFITYGKEFRHFGSYQAIADRLITTSGFSKAFSMAGFRIGWLVANERSLQQFKAYQEVTLSGVSMFTQYAAREALKTRNEYLPPLVEELRLKRDNGLRILNSIPGLNCPEPEGAFYYFPDVSSFFGKTAPNGRRIHSAAELTAYLNSICKVQVFCGDLFGMPLNLRLSFSGQADDLYEALNRLKTALAELR